MVGFPSGVGFPIRGVVSSIRGVGFPHLRDGMSYSLGEFFIRGVGFPICGLGFLFVGWGFLFVGWGFLFVGWGFLFVGWGFLFVGWDFFSWGLFVGLLRWPIPGAYSWGLIVGPIRGVHSWGPLVGRFCSGVGFLFVGWVSYSWGGFFIRGLGFPIPGLGLSIRGLGFPIRGLGFSIRGSWGGVSFSWDHLWGSVVVFVGLGVQSWE